MQKPIVLIVAGLLAAFTVMAVLKARFSESEEKAAKKNRKH